MASGIFTINQVNQAIRQGAWSGYIAPTWVEYLVVAGGGSGGSNYGGGGGAGGLLTGIVSITAGTSYTVTVGGGGAAKVFNAGTGANGVDSLFGSISASGGGGGGKGNGTNGASGGSGGGGGGYAGLIGGQGTANQGNKGGTGIGDPSKIGAGGGGAGTSGLNGVSSGPGGNGGAGIASSISGAVVTYAGGGGGGADGSGNGTAAGAGGVGGGGAGGFATYPATADGTSGGGNTGGGGGGPSQGGTSGAGGSGVVIVRYPGSVQFFTGGTLSYGNGYVIHTFYSSGTLAPTTPTPYIDSTYQISRSLRFNSADSAYLNRTPASASNQKTWTYSGWVKRSLLTSAQNLMSQGDTYIDLNGSDQIEINLRTAGTNYLLGSTAVYRDPSAWYHIVVACDTTNATAADRLKLWVNGVQITSYAYNSYTSIPQNQNTGFNAASVHRLGSSTLYGEYLGGYMTEVNFIDGQALTPSSFGYTNPSTGVWSPVRFVGTYGTNGFYLNFSDNSNTTAATLGKDYSGNGNNWTPNNFSVSAGAGNDSLVDSPTSYGTDTGVGGTVRGNYCTLNPLGNTSTYATLSNGNLDVVPDSTHYPMVPATFGMTSGKWYWEYTLGASGNGGRLLGIVNGSASTTNYVGSNANGWGYYGGSGQKYTNNSGSAYGSSFTNGDVIGVAFDADAGTLVFYKNNTSQGTAFSSLTSGPYFPAWSAGDAGQTGTTSLNFGQRPFAYTAPSGYKALCTQNLPTPTIGATSTTLAGKYFNPVLYTGTGATLSVTGAGFQPDFTWIKQRNASRNHNVYDAVRGVLKVLQPNVTDAEVNYAGSLTSFDSDGFSLGTASDVNVNAATYVAWNWKANGSGSSNTAGSITSTVSANTTSGFSVVTYTGNGTGGSTVGHGLGVAPSMMIIKRRSTTAAWVVYHASLGPTQGIYLNLTDAVYTGSTFWYNTAPSSSVFTLGTVSENNVNSSTYVAYCFAEVAGYSKFGSWTGNGSSDGVFVYCGFRPAYVLMKGTNSNGYIWTVYDSKRNTYNVANLFLEPDSSGAETTFTTLDFLSNGFKIRSSDSAFNASGSTYIFAAFAESPFKYSLAR